MEETLLNLLLFSRTTFARQLVEADGTAPETLKGGEFLNLLAQKMGEQGTAPVGAEGVAGTTEKTGTAVPSTRGTGVPAAEGASVSIPIGKGTSAPSAPSGTGGLKIPNMNNSAPDVAAVPVRASIPDIGSNCNEQPLSVAALFASATSLPSVAGRTAPLGTSSADVAAEPHDLADDLSGQSSFTRDGSGSGEATREGTGNRDSKTDLVRKGTPVCGPDEAAVLEAYTTGSVRASRQTADSKTVQPDLVRLLMKGASARSISAESVQPADPQVSVNIDEATAAPVHAGLETAETPRAGTGSKAAPRDLVQSFIPGVPARDIVQPTTEGRTSTVGPEEKEKLEIPGEKGHSTEASLAAGLISVREMMGKFLTGPSPASQDISPSENRNSTAEQVVPAAKEEAKAVPPNSAGAGRNRGISGGEANNRIDTGTRETRQAAAKDLPPGVIGPEVSPDLSPLLFASASGVRIVDNKDRVDFTQDRKNVTSREKRFPGSVKETIPFITVQGKTASLETAVSSATGETGLQDGQVPPRMPKLLASMEVLHLEEGAAAGIRPETSLPASFSLETAGRGTANAPETDESGSVPMNSIYASQDFLKRMTGDSRNTFNNQNLGVSSRTSDENIGSSAGSDAFSSAEPGSGHPADSPVQPLTGSLTEKGAMTAVDPRADFHAATEDRTQLKNAVVTAGVHYSPETGVQSKKTFDGTPDDESAAVPQNLSTYRQAREPIPEEAKRSTPSLKTLSGEKGKETTTTLSVGEPTDESRKTSQNGPSAGTTPRPMPESVTKPPVDDSPGNRPAAESTPSPAGRGDHSVQKSVDSGQPATYAPVTQETAELTNKAHPVSDGSRKLEVSEAAAEDKAVSIPGGKDRDVTAGKEQKDFTPQGDMAKTAPNREGEHAGKSDKTHFLATMTDRIEKIAQDYSQRNSSTDMTVRLKMDEGTLLVGLKDDGQRISVEIKTASEGLMNLLQAQKEEIVRHLETRNITASIFVDPEGDRNFQKRDQRNPEKRQNGKGKEQDGFVEFLETFV